MPRYKPCPESDAIIQQMLEEEVFHTEVIDGEVMYRLLSTRKQPAWHQSSVPVIISGPHETVTVTVKMWPTGADYWTTEPSARTSFACSMNKWQIARAIEAPARVVQWERVGKRKRSGSTDMFSWSFIYPNPMTFEKMRAACAMIYGKAVHRLEWADKVTRLKIMVGIFDYRTENPPIARRDAVKEAMKRIANMTGWEQVFTEMDLPTVDRWLEVGEMAEKKYLEENHEAENVA